MPTDKLERGQIMLVLLDLFTGESTKRRAIGKALRWGIGVYIAFGWVSGQYKDEAARRDRWDKAAALTVQVAAFADSLREAGITPVGENSFREQSNVSYLVELERDPAAVEKAWRELRMRPGKYNVLDTLPFLEHDLIIGHQAFTFHNTQ